MIEIDDNEITTGSRVADYLEAWKVPFKIRSAPIGEPNFDYIVTNQNLDRAIGVEHKEINDYLQSKQNGHLDTQLFELSKNFQLSYVVVVGSRKTLGNNKALRNSYISSFIGCSLKRASEGKQGQIVTVDDGVINSEEEFALFLKYLNDKIEHEPLTRLPKMERFTPSKNQIAINVLCNFPQVGIVRATAILQKYGSLKHFFSQIDLGLPINVEGINEKVECLIFEAYHHQYGDEQ